MLRYVRAYEGNNPHIFISYAHKDSEQVLPVIFSLYERKYRVWYDEGIAPGSEWPQNISSHLQKASVIIAFISKNSLSSPNCENEIMLAMNKSKDIIVISLDGKSRHSLLRPKKVLQYNNSLIDKLANIETLSDELIGDGISGYQYLTDKKRNFNIWNLLLGLAAVLAVIFSISLYGLYVGWFDDMLPKKNTSVEDAIKVIQPLEIVSIDSNMIGSVLPVKFTSNEEKIAVYQKLGWAEPNEMTYKDLVEMDWITHIEIGDEPINDITFVAYLPNLETIELSNSRITDLSPLIECPKLKEVQLTADILPVILPSPRSFIVEIM